ncbi:MAG: putative DNA binding domain-containing protein [Cyclobacteriaceae bacterium]
MITSEQLLHIADKREGESLEFKSSFNKSVIETIVGFANTKGGKIVIGVSDKKEILGVSIGQESVQKWINEIKQHTEPSVIPDVEILELEGKTVVVMEVQDFPNKNIENSGGYFVEVSYKQQKTESKATVINDPVNDPVNDRMNRILKILEQNKSITREQLAGASNVSVETIKRDLRKLRDQGKVKRIGSDKTGYWEVIR